MGCFEPRLSELPRSSAEQLSTVDAVCGFLTCGLYAAEYGAHLQASCPAWKRCCAPSQPSAPTAWWSSATAPRRWTLRATCAGARSRCGAGQRTSNVHSNGDGVPMKWPVRSRQCVHTVCASRPLHVLMLTRRWCSGLGLPTCRIDGATTVESRQDIVNTFNSSHANVRVWTQSRRSVQPELSTQWRHICQQLQRTPASHWREAMATHVPRLPCTHWHNQRGASTFIRRLRRCGQVCLLSTRAGGAGLNLIGANHLVGPVALPFPQLSCLIVQRQRQVPDNDPTPLACPAICRCCSTRIGTPLMTSRHAHVSPHLAPGVLINVLLTCLHPMLLYRPAGNGTYLAGRPAEALLHLPPADHRCDCHHLR